MATYFVKMLMRMAEVEKEICTLITADSEVNAGKFALALESNQPVFKASDLVHDGEVSYRVYTTKRLNDTELAVFSRYMKVYQYDEQELQNMVDN